MEDIHYKNHHILKCKDADGRTQFLIHDETSHQVAIAKTEQEAKDFIDERI